MKKILIAGGAGFIGHHLCKKLLKKKCLIICVDNLSTGSVKNINEFKTNKNFKFIKKDITSNINISCDEIYNLACPASPKQYQINPINTLKTNVMGSYNLLELAKKNNAKIFQASTSEIYGDPINHPQKENYWGNVNPIGKRSCYDEGKRSAETLFFDFHRTYKLQIKVARIFNTFGPNMDTNDGRVVSNIINSCLNNKNIHIYGSGKQTRCFCFVDDTVEAIIKFMETDKNILGPINIGSNNEISILKLTKIILKLTQSKSKIKFMKRPSDDPVRRKPNLSKAKKILNWKPKTSLEEGLSKTIKYFNNL